MACKLQTIGIRKEYPGTVALNDVSVRFEGRKVHALLGKNGAGKSTLVKILSGVVRPTAGTILVDGRPVELRGAADAFANGIATVYQELSLIRELSVAENILLGRLPRRRGIIDWKAAYAQAEEVLGGMQVRLDVKTRVGDLGVAQQQIVEIAKAMSFRPSALLLDEPTSALARHETESLFALVRKLADAGVAILYITHRLQELHRIADTVTVLRDGEHVGSVLYRDVTPAKIVQMMFGQVVPKHRPAELKAGDEPLMEVRGLGRAGVFSDVSFTVRRGEILGIAGMLGSGRTELLRAIFGADAFDAGEIRLEGKTIRPGSPATMRDLGLAFTPENRKEEGLVPMLNTRANVCMASLDRLSRRGVITRSSERSIVQRLVERLSIKVPDIEQPIESLSGGNQQKAIVARWLNTRPRIMLFDEPTRGIDVLAKQQIFRIMWDLSRDGVGCVFVSSELEELVEVCHRIVVMRQGRIEAEIEPEMVSAEQLCVMCMDEGLPTNLHESTRM